MRASPTGALALAVAALEPLPQCGIAGARLPQSRRLHPEFHRQFPLARHRALNKSLLRRLAPAAFSRKEIPFTEPAPVESVIGAFMLIRRRVWDEIGGFDERYFFFFEETDFCLQARPPRLGNLAPAASPRVACPGQDRQAGPGPPPASSIGARVTFISPKTSRRSPAPRCARASPCVSLSTPFPRGPRRS